MTGNLFLDWATMAVSLFNTILAFWLGLTVLLRAERRHRRRPRAKTEGSHESVARVRAQLQRGPPPGSR